MGVLTTLIGGGLNPEYVMDLDMMAAIALCVLYRKQRAYERMVYISDTSAVLGSMLSKKDVMKPYLASIMKEIEGD